MIFTTLALLSGMSLFAAAAPWYNSYDPVTYYVNVSNNTAGLLYDPPYIVSQPSNHYISTLIVIRLSFRPLSLETPYRSPSIPRTTL